MIGVYDDCFPIDVAQRMVNEFEKTFHNDQSVFNVETRERGRPIREISLHVNSNLNTFVGNVNQAVHKAFERYLEEYSHLKVVPMCSNSISMRRSQECGGDNDWHWDSQSNANCVLTWMVFLNSAEPDEGEVEFFLQGERHRPVAGRVLIWPAGCTHPWRHNPAYSRPKYVLHGCYVNIPQPSDLVLSTQ